MQNNNYSEIRWNILMIVLLITIIVIMTMESSFAGHGYGTKLTFSSGSKSYTGYSEVITNSNAFAYQRTKCNSSAAEGGWLGSKARLYKSSGALKGASSWYYNPKKVSKGNNYWAYWYCHSGSNKSYYSHGQSRGWNPKKSEYTTKTTPKSPNQTTN